MTIVQLIANIRNVSIVLEYQLFTPLKCTTRAWLGHAVVVERHLKLKDYYMTLMNQNMGNITQHRDTVDKRFIDDAKVHLKYL